jgi:hypothetical protein
MRKYLCILPVVLVAWTALPGQSYADPYSLPRHEFAFYAGGGQSTLRCESSIGAYEAMTGGLFGADYRAYFSKWVGFGVGLEVSYYNAKGTIAEYVCVEQATDPEGADFEFHTDLRDYGEKENITMLNIPLMLRFRGNPEKHRPYAAIGAKVSIPLSGKYEIVEGTSRNYGYYAFENYQYDTQQFMGFGAFPGAGAQDLQLKPACLLALEAGMNWRLRYFLLYTGFYLDYGLGNVVEKTDKLIVSYNSEDPANRYTGSMINSQYKLEDGQLEQMTTNVLPIAIGFKIGVTLGHGRKKEQYGNYDQAPIFIYKRR